MAAFKWLLAPKSKSIRLLFGFQKIFNVGKYHVNLNFLIVVQTVLVIIKFYTLGVIDISSSLYLVSNVLMLSL